MDKEHHADELIASWSANAGRWTEAVRSGAIASRRLVTDRAVLEAVLRSRPRRVLDLGCGEGWLARAMAGEVEEVVGVDASPELVAKAAAAGGAKYLRASYAEIVAQPARLGGHFDAVVVNFALLAQDVAPLLATLHSLTRPGGALVIQTLHPIAVSPPYEDGWRREDFSGFGADTGWRAMPWYFRTLGSWFAVVSTAWRLTSIQEPLHPQTRAPASLLLTAEA